MSCEGIVDRCSRVGINILIINETDAELGVLYRLEGCKDERSGVTIGELQRTVEYTSTLGTNMLYVNLFIADGWEPLILARTSSKVAINNQQFIMKITFDGDNYQLNFL